MCNVIATGQMPPVCFLSANQSNSRGFEFSNKRKHFCLKTIIMVVIWWFAWWWLWWCWRLWWWQGVSHRGGVLGRWRKCCLIRTGASSSSPSPSLSSSPSPSSSSPLSPSLCEHCSLSRWLKWCLIRTHRVSWGRKGVEIMRSAKWIFYLSSFVNLGS